MTDQPLAPGPDTPVYVISVAAQLTGLHPQTLRTYDRLGLVSPGRTVGGGRRYSMRDVEMLRNVVRLTADGLGLEGVRRVLELENQVSALQTRVLELTAELDDVYARLGAPGNLPARLATGQQIVLWHRQH